MRSNAESGSDWIGESAIVGDAIRAFVVIIFAIAATWVARDESYPQPTRVDAAAGAPAAGKTAPA